MTTLEDIFRDLEGRTAPDGKPVLRGAKDVKTAIRYLAAALGYASPAQCPVEQALVEEHAWATTLDTHFDQLQTHDNAKARTISLGTRNNVRTNLRRFFREAAAHGVLQAPLPTVRIERRVRKGFEKQFYQQSPYLRTYSEKSRPPYALHQAAWPDDIKQGWQTYRTQCGLRLREITFKAYAKHLETYFGYRQNVVGRSPTWDDLFDVGLLTDYVRWHGKRMNSGRVSHHARNTVIIVAAIAKVLAHPQARALADLRNTLKKPAPLHKEHHHPLTREDIEAVAEQCLVDGRRSFFDRPYLRSPGVTRACRFQVGVILKLLKRIPFRQRNIRELRIADHLIQQEDGSWVIHIEGDDLKVSHRKDEVNRLDFNLSALYPDFIPVLEEFLTEYRPRFPGAKESPFVFLTQRGTPFTNKTLGTAISMTVALYTGKRFYPHRFRHLFATEYLNDTKDYAGAAEMLGDTLKVVMTTYYKYDTQERLAKAAEWANNQHKRPA